MGIYASQCVTCSEASKKPDGVYHGIDENRKPFSGQMYHCDNFSCPINQARIHHKKASYNGHLSLNNSRKPN